MKASQQVISYGLVCLGLVLAAGCVVDKDSQPRIGQFGWLNHILNEAVKIISSIPRLLDRL